MWDWCVQIVGGLCLSLLFIDSPRLPADQQRYGFAIGALRAAAGIGFMLCLSSLLKEAK